MSPARAVGAARNDRPRVPKKKVAGGAFAASASVATTEGPEVQVLPESLKRAKRAASGTPVVQTSRTDRSVRAHNEKGWSRPVKVWTSEFGKSQQSLLLQQTPSLRDGGVRGIVAHDLTTVGTRSRTRNQSTPARDDHQGWLRVRGPTPSKVSQSWTHKPPTSVDGVGALDLISRRAMLEGLREVNAAVVPFARLFYGQRSEYLWENNLGEIPTISQRVTQ